MKQGTGKNSMHGKDTMHRQGVSPGAVSRMGAHEADLKRPPKMFKPAGTSAPKAMRSTHHCGTQGKH